MFEGPQNSVQNLLNKRDSYGCIILLNTSFVDNFATQLGSAIIATNVEDVLLSCDYVGGRQKDFLDQGNCTFLALIDPKQLCPSWTGNRLAEPRTQGLVGTFGKRLSLSIIHPNSSTGVKLSGNEIIGFVFEHVQSGKRLPEIIFTVVDAFGNGPAPTVPDLLWLTIISPDGFFQGVLTTNTTFGRGRISGIIGFKSPGYYTINITTQISTIVESILKIHVRSCLIGEEPTIDYELCQACDEFSYNFDVERPGGCVPCPEGATCQGGYIVPKDGYWHKGPCHDILKQCVTKDACTYETRHKVLADFTVNFTSCNISTMTLQKYDDLQCNEVRTRQQAKFFLSDKMH